VSPLLPLLLGLLALFAAVLVLRSFGPRYRVGRLLATTPRISVGEARAIAERGERRYLRVDGRVDGQEEFRDADHRPLVFRRTRLEARQGRRWRPFEDQRESVPFVVREGLDEIGVDAGSLDDGLVVLPRESLGVAADLPDRAPADLPPETPIRARIEHVSSVEHATVLGVPVRGASGEVQMSAGLGRPLVLTTLEVREAMKILTEGDTSRPRAAAGLLVAGLGLVVLSMGWAVVSLIV
jgi:hypothetical protein